MYQGKQALAFEQQQGVAKQHLSIAWKCEREGKRASTSILM